MAGLQNGRRSLWQGGMVSEWQEGSIEVWQDGRIAGWQEGTVARWEEGSMYGWQVSRRAGGRLAVTLIKVCPGFTVQRLPEMPGPELKPKFWQRSSRGRGEGGKEEGKESGRILGDQVKKEKGIRGKREERRGKEG